MLEYLFFNDSVAQRFRDFLTLQGIAFQDRVELVQEALLIILEDPKDDELLQLLEDRYDELALEDQDMAEELEGENADNRAGIHLQLADGSETIAKVDPQILNRILTAVSMDELLQLLDVVVRSVENPDDSPICHVDDYEDH